MRFDHKASIKIALLLWMLPSAALAHVYATKTKRPSTTTHVHNKPSAFFAKKPAKPFFKPNSAVAALQQTIGNHGVNKLVNFAKIPVSQAHVLLQKVMSNVPKSQFSEWYKGSHKQNEPARPAEAVAELFKLQASHLNAIMNTQLHPDSLPFFLRQMAASVPMNKLVPTDLKAAEQWAMSVFGFQRDPTNKQVLEAYKNAVGKTPESQIGKVTYAAYLLLKTDAHTQGRKQKPGKEPGKDQTNKNQTGKDQTGKDQTGKDQTGKDQTGNQTQSVDRSQVAPFLQHRITIQQDRPSAQRQIIPIYTPSKQQRREEEDPRINLPVFQAE